MHIMLGLLGLSCTELHGNMTQAQRLEALKRFSYVGVSDECKNKSAIDQLSEMNEHDIRPVDILLATDLASRGLDIPNVQTVSFNCAFVVSIVILCIMYFNVFKVNSKVAKFYETPTFQLNQSTDCLSRNTSLWHPPYSSDGLIGVPYDNITTSKL